jgi:hypothetical protein
MLGPNRPWICGVYVQPSHFSAQERTRETILATDKTFHCWVNEVIKAALSQQDSTEHSAICYTTTALTYL